jgi:hypothetical protein
VSGSEAGLLARKTWRTVEPLHGMIYFVREGVEAYAALGIQGRTGYFASRSAAMGAVSAEVVKATFFNFNPALVSAAIPAAWSITTPDALLAARLAAVDKACRRLLGDDVIGSDEVRRAAALARTAAEEASARVEGRPLAAGHAGLPWPDDAHLVLWHAQSILREFRGDGHIALLVTRGLGGLDALITHAASGEVPADLLRTTRGWPEEDWDAAVDSMRSRGWITSDKEITFSAWGATQRREIEEQTDELASAPYAALGDEGCSELRTLVRPWSKIFSDVLFR